MPLPPSTWVSGIPVTAYQLNIDLYCYVPGSNHASNGIKYHATPPILMENLYANVAGSQPANASKQMFSASTPTWRSHLDNSVLLGPNRGDAPGLIAQGAFTAAAPGSDGTASGGATIPTTPPLPPLGRGGNYLAIMQAGWVAAASAGGAGTLLYSDEGGTLWSYGGVQQASPTQNNLSYLVDVIGPWIDGTYVSNMGGYSATTGVTALTYLFNNKDYTGETSKFMFMWAGPDASSAAPVQATLPVPAAGYTSASLITSAQLNGSTGIRGVLQFLNNPPLLRAAAGLTTSVANSASPSPTVIQVNAAGIDSYAGYNTGTFAYTVPVSGVYLVSGLVSWAANATGERMTGIYVNGSLALWGPAYSAAGSGITCSQVTRLLDLNAGDTIQLIGSQSSGGALSLSGTASCRLVLRWMAALAPSSGSVAWTPPDAGFRWQAGTPGSQLPGLFNTHLANDLSFLLQRPYLLSYQTTAQAAQAQNAYNVVTMDKLGGRVHTSAGDNYGGWVAGATNRYVAVVPGWYLVVGSYHQAVPSSTPAHPIGAFGYYTSGGAAQGINAQVVGQHVRTVSAGYPPGADAIWIVYLRAGDYVQPQYQQQDGGATYATTVAAGQESNLGVVWVSE